MPQPTLLSGLQKIAHQSTAPFQRQHSNDNSDPFNGTISNSPSQYKVFRNVKDYGAKARSAILRSPIGVLTSHPPNATFTNGSLVLDDVKLRNVRTAIQGVGNFILERGSLGQSTHEFKVTENNDTQILQDVIIQAASTGKAVFIDAGVYKITRTLCVPRESKIVGEAYSAILPSGPFFADMQNPQPAEAIGKEWNIASAGIPSGMWDVHLNAVRAVFMGQIQTEIAYYQPNAPAPLPFTTSSGLGDPDFSAQDNTQVGPPHHRLLGHCSLWRWTLFFLQQLQQSLEGHGNINIKIYNLNIIGATSMINVDGKSIAKAEDNKNVIPDTIAVFTP
ncbi:MAG: hypothetical protein Q9218_006797 [Villophora microphyllina]